MILKRGDSLGVLDNYKDALESIFYIITLCGMIFGFYKVLSLKNYQKNCKEFYGIDTNNFPVLKVCDKETFNLILFQIAIIIVMIFNISKEPNIGIGSMIIYILGIIMIVTMNWSNYLIYKYLKNKKLFKIDLIIPSLSILLVILIKSVKEFESFLHFVQVSELILYLGLIVSSTVKLFTPLLFNPKDIREYEIVKLEDSINNNEMCVKIGRNNDGFLIMKGKIIEQYNRKEEVLTIVDGDKKGSTEVNHLSSECKKILFICRGVYRYIDPQKCKLQILNFDDVKVIGEDEFNMESTENN